MEATLYCVVILEQFSLIHPWDQSLDRVILVLIYDFGVDLTNYLIAY